MALVEVKDLYKIFGPNPRRAIPMIKEGKSKQEIKKKTGCTIAINGATFDIHRKETFVVMGLSGSGKSTFIRCLNRLIRPTAGAILIDGQDIMKMNKEELQKLRRYKMSMVFQNFGLLPHRNVVDNVEFGLEIGGMGKEERRAKAFEALKLVGLESFEFSMPHELSGGMQQRVGLARAMANDPEILLMDEAFSALDPLIRSQMQDELLELQSKMHKTIIFITHDLDEALKLGDRIAILGPDGKVRQIGTPEEILSAPADTYVEKFVQNVDRTRVITAGAIVHRTPQVNLVKDGPESALRLMEKERLPHAFVVDAERVLQGIISIEDVVRLKKEKKKDLKEIINAEVYTTSMDTAISDLLATAVESPYPIAVITEGKFHGIVDRAAIIAEVNEGIKDSESPTVLSDVLNEDNTEQEDR
ncbi:quaternary amine ABC transporter ATP-binding protein [Spirochaeta cellobiosiphila]|uniref:quaternary amine ABC transporter ATP-binding protein n=1 Tax=Spirochaeta cellobiosiphila TaxID=504483 RepID=UPI0003F5B07E|nr:glycine betaine/L-proline ABC transporter ATP-binding protein [Spirochaeta cellobiosiphila]